MVLSAKNAAAPTNWNTIETWPGAARPMKRPTLPDSKQKRVNYALTNSNALTARMTTLLMTPPAPTGNTTSTESSIPRKHKSLEKSGPTQFAQLWAGTNNE